jgi:hypothetical protein
VPNWLSTYNFKHDTFTFVRIQYDPLVKRYAAWATDFPDADLNLAMQLGKMTKLDVSVPSKVLRVTDADLVNYPFTYIAEPGSLYLSDIEITAMREYLLGGGFLLVDDIWGEAEWENLRSVMKKIFPKSEPRELPLSHPLFHCVFDMKERPQVPSISTFFSGKGAVNRLDAPRYLGIDDDNGRLMVLMCHNTDLADGWERVGENSSYRREVSEPMAFPMGINIVYFALTQVGGKKGTP